MKERPLIAFTLLAQMAAGACLALLALSLYSWLAAGRELPPGLVPAVWAMAGSTMLLAMAASLAHLAAPRMAWRAAAGWRSSWLSREILASGSFSGLLIVLTGLASLAPGLALRLIGPWLAALAGATLIYCMARAYRLPAVPAWNTRLHLASFVVSALLLGQLAVAALLLAIDPAGAALPGVYGFSVAAVALLLAANLGLLGWWLARLFAGPPAARAAAAGISGAGHALLLRVALALLAMITAGFTLMAPSGMAHVTFGLTAGLALLSEVVGRTLFYAGHTPHDAYLYAG